MKRVIATVIENRQISCQRHLSLGRYISGSRLVRLECSDIGEVSPGQFLMVRCGDECLLSRPFSIHQTDSKGITLLFSVWEEGKGTNWLSQRRVGDSVNLLGPLGNGFSISPDSKNLLLVAGGVGIAPLRFLAERALSGGCSVTLLLGTKTQAQLDPTLLRMSPEIRLVMATEDGTAGKKGKVTELLPDFVDRADQIFVSGPVPMCHDIALRKQELGLEAKPVQVSLEVRMGCGLGICYGCTVKTRSGLKKVCRDGPVFNLDDIIWDGLGW